MSVSMWRPHSPPREKERVGSGKERDTHQGRGDQSAGRRRGYSLVTTIGNFQVFLSPHTPLPSPLAFAVTHSPLGFKIVTVPGSQLLTLTQSRVITWVGGKREAKNLGRTIHFAGVLTSQSELFQPPYLFLGSWQLNVSPLRSTHFQHCGGTLRHNSPL